MKTKEYYELLGRINEFESRLNKLESKSENEFKEEKDVQNVKDAKISKNKMIADIRKILSLDLEEKGFFIRKAIPKNGEGSGIIIEDEDKAIKKKIMVKKSKDYSGQYNFQNEYNFSGWFTLNSSEINEYNDYIFTVYKDAVPTYFVFDKDDMKVILNQKTFDSKGNYHFYLAEDKKGQYFDHRDGEIILSGNVNAWEKI
ncbi:hypothetical protein CPT_Machias_228 [Staphylococcus phage Machias]|nr:hypothetical protein CPT_Machias_228 [Staphylococcus phage Machias]